ncbi:MAG TPA: glycosyl hydrolase [Gaiellaceae bacterium]
MATALLAAAGLAVSAATAAPKKPTVKRSTHLLVGINDEADTLYGDPASAFTTLKSLKTQVLRVNLYWGGTKWAVANNRRPTDPNDPGDQAYNWALYDRLVQYAHDTGIQVVFSILFTPKWANGGKARTVPPKNYKDLENFAYAAAERYSGLWIPPEWQQNASLGIGNHPLPKVNMWTAWNEPNNPLWLTPQYKRVGKTWRVESAFNYAKICNAVMAGVHSKFLGPLSDEHVACGVTGPKGNDAPATKRASVDALTFLTQAHRFGMKDFDVYAHHPYADKGAESPSYIPKGKQKMRVQLGNINTLLKLVSKYYGPKHLWITEYGYQTNPPDKTVFGISWKTQAKYMAQAYAIARKNPRIDMMLWFMVRDEPNIGGWQSGLETIGNKRKPSWKTFVGLPRG